MRVIDTNRGDVFFIEDHFGLEIRETWYRRKGDRVVLLGVVQGDPTLTDARGDPVPPRVLALAGERATFRVIDPDLSVRREGESRFSGPRRTEAF